MTKVIGIDLGTTFSAIASLDDLGNPEVLASIEDNRKITASAIYLKDNEVVVGDKAYRVTLGLSSCLQTCVKIDSAVEVSKGSDNAGVYSDGELTVYAIDVLGKLYSAGFQMSNESTYEFILLEASLIGVKTDPNSMYFSWDVGYGTPSEEKPQLSLIHI